MPDRDIRIAEKKTTEFEEPYPNKYGQQVLWKFIEAVDCLIILVPHGQTKLILNKKFKPRKYFVIIGCGPGRFR